MTNQESKSVPPITKSANEIAVTSYSQILLWPVLLQEPSDESSKETSSRKQPQLQPWIDQFCENGWSEAGTLARDITPSDIARWDMPSGNASQDMPGNEPTYEEIVYFHPFVRDFLYGEGDPPEDETMRREYQEQRSLRRLTRDDVQEMEVTLVKADGDRTFIFDVVRTELYLCKPLVAILVLEVWWSEEKSRPHVPKNTLPLSLANVETLQSRIRQVYPPFFFGDTPGNSPLHVKLFKQCDANKRIENPMGSSDFHEGRDHFAEFTHQGAEPAVGEHWKKLLEPFEPFSHCTRNKPAYRQIIDDRIPGMTYVTVDDPREIQPGDFDRLTFCEPCGDASYPYAREFLEAHHDHYCYDRFWRETTEEDTEHLVLNTRYLCSGYQFVAVGASGNWFFNSLIRDHFRRHYFRIALVVHYHRAALLKFADEMADAIELLKGKDPEEEWRDKTFLQRVSHLQMTFLKFRSRSWFTEVSNQLQGQELFAWWSDLLDTQRLFDHVDQLNQQVYSGLAEYEGRQLSRRSNYLAWAALIIALVSFVISLHGCIPWSHDSSTATPSAATAFQESIASDE